MAGLEPYPALKATDLIHTPAKAIVVLSADQITNAPEFGQPVVGKLTLQRLRYAAWLYRQTHLPIIVSGGSCANDTHSLAQLMAHSLREEFGVPVMAMEEQSVNTRENAQFTADWLTAHHIKTILLVTHAWHLPRAVAAFERVGIEVIPAPTGFAYDKNSQFKWDDVLPTAQALLMSYYALHEYSGQLWYTVYARFNSV
ncbi:YdcF family protein [Rhodopseudomonas palustris]|nr:YdcF family protein [Rhodopseudomonas palustris]